MERRAWAAAWARQGPPKPLSSDDGPTAVPAMRAVRVALLVALASVRRSRASLDLEVLALPHLRRILKDHCSHDHRCRGHQSLGMDCRDPHPLQAPELGDLVEVREAGGLYRRCQRLAG